MSNWDSEQYAVAESFQEGMAPFRQEPLVLYGTGKNTQAVLELANGFHIVGLLDQNAGNIGKAVYGKYVLSLDEAAAVSKKIVIIARNAVVPIIYHRIRSFAAEKGISIYNYAGRLLGAPEPSYDASGLDYWNHTYEDLQTAIAGHEVISFDIFDTLVGRRVLQPQDVFSLVERDLRAAGCRAPFAGLRMQAEKECGYAASLDDIYGQIRRMGIPADDCRDWRERELAWEKRVISPRRKMVEAFRYAKDLGKPVFLVSDMYLPKTEIAKLLEICGVTGYDGLLVSCEEKAEKSDGALFARLLEKSGSNSVLHIGDNAFCDGQMARSKGIDPWQIYSGYDLLAVSGVQSLLVDPPQELGGRAARGMLCAELFNDPFALHKTKGKVVLSQAEQVGYCFLGPWALSFMQWAAEQARTHNIEEFLFTSRDGFLFYRIGKIMQKYGCMPNVTLKYIKTSRNALAAASIQSESDLRDTINRRPYYGMRGKMLQDWFRVEPNISDTAQAAPAVEKELTFQYARTYLPQIMERSSWERKNYRAYLQSQDLFHDQKTAVFDFVANGTVQYYLERLLEKPLLGLYCGRRTGSGQTLLPALDILSAFGNFSDYGESLHFSLLQVYTLMEALLIDGDRSLAYFDENVQPVFQADNGFSYEQALQTQEFILAFANDYFALLGPEMISLETANQFLRALLSKTCQIVQPAANAFVHDDVQEVNPTKDIAFLSNSKF